MANYYPPVGFHFKVEVQGLDKQVDHDVRFTDVSGLSMEMATEEVAEGGQNRFLQKYPLRAKHPDLVLKRGLLTDSGIVTWVRECIEDFNISVKNLLSTKIFSLKHGITAIQVSEKPNFHISKVNQANIPANPTPSNKIIR